MNKAYIILLLTILFFSCSKNKYQANLNKNSSDSLYKYIALAQNQQLSLISRVKYNRAAYIILENEIGDSIYRSNLYKVAQEFLNLQQDKDFKKTLNLVLKNSLEKKDTFYIAKSYNLLGSYHINIQKNDSAFYYLLKSEKLFHKLQDSLSLGQNYIDKAFVQLYESDYSGCELSSIQALSYYKNFNVPRKEYDAYNLIGICSNELKNYNNALEYHYKALNIVKEYELISKFNLEANSKNNIGIVYQYQDKHHEAIKIFNSALLEKSLVKENPSLYGMIMDNLAYSNFKLKNYQGLPELFYRALKIREENHLSSGIIINKIHLSEFYAEKNDTLNAQKFAHEALQLAKTTKITGDILGSLKQLSTVEHRNASQYSKEYIKISDSLQQEERKAKDRFARIQFETDEIIVEKDKLAEQNRSLLYFFVGTLLIGLLLFIIRSQRAKNRELLLIQAQQKANEDIYNLMISQQATIEESRVKEKKRIAQELHDGVLGRLFGVRLTLDSLNKFNDEASINSRLNYLSELKNIEQDIREISHDLNKEKYVLINNFVAIVSNLIEEQKKLYDPDVTLTIDKVIKWDSVSNSIKINLYRILQEALQNINKYASAKNIIITLSQESNNIRLEIIDDGIGFDISVKKKGIGLQNMIARIEECKGTLEIKSKKHIGTKIFAIVPI